MRKILSVNASRQTAIGYIFCLTAYNNFMVDAIKAFFNAAVTNPYLAGILISMLPVVELRGGMPYLYYRLGGKGFFDLSKAFMCSFIGSCAIIPLLLLFFVPVIELFKKSRVFGGLAIKIESHFAKKSRSLSTAAADGGALSIDAFNAAAKRERIKYNGLLIFAALPIPFTGVWTSSAVAAIMRLDVKKAFCYILLGNFICGIIVGAASLVFSVFI